MTIDFLHNYSVKYTYLSNILRKIIYPYSIFDALSEYSFYEKGLVDEPVVVEDEITLFKKIM